MRLLVVGAGSTGGYFGGRLAQAGRDVTFLVRPARAERLRATGLQIVSPHGDVTLTPNLVTAGKIEAPYDAILLTVKAFSLHAALDDLAPAVGPDTMILPVLNGMKHVDTLIARFGQPAVVGCVCKSRHPGRWPRPHCAAQQAPGPRLWRNEWPTLGPHSRARHAHARRRLRCPPVTNHRARDVGEMGAARHARWHLLPDARHHRAGRSRPARSRIFARLPR